MCGAARRRMRLWRRSKRSTRITTWLDARARARETYPLGCCWWVYSWGAGTWLRKRLNCPLFVRDGMKSTRCLRSSIARGSVGLCMSVCGVAQWYTVLLEEVHRGRAQRREEQRAQQQDRREDRMLACIAADRAVARGCLRRPTGAAHAHAREASSARSSKQHWQGPASVQYR